MKFNSILGYIRDNISLDVLFDYINRLNPILGVVECCGIVGYMGDDDTKEILLRGIEILKNRGYDSCGISTINDIGELSVTKCSSVSTPADCSDILRNLTMNGHNNSRLGIGHTRWATIGGPSDDNAHPHIDLKGRLSLVHNGTVSNILEIYNEYYKPAIESGEIPMFTLPDCDSKAIITFIGLEYDRSGDLLESFRNILSKLNGTWALCMISTNHPNSIFVASMDAPLLLARSDDGNSIYVGSEVGVFTNKASEYIVLKNGDIYELTYDKVNELYKELGVRKSIIEDYDDSPYPYIHWYMKEAMEQPCVGRLILKYMKYIDGDKIINSRIKLLRNASSVLYQLKDVKRELEMLTNINEKIIQFEIIDFNNNIIKQLENCNNLLYVACGSSKYSSMYVCNILQKFNLLNMIEVDDSSDLTLYRYLNDCIVIHVSNSGETLDCLLAYKLIKSLNPNSLNITLVNTPHSTLSRTCDAVAYLGIGKEISVPSTKAFTSQIAILLLISLTCIIKKMGLI